jgi:hypothetical protein
MYRIAKVFGILAVAGFLSLIPNPVYAHCDTMDGPVVMDARNALEQGDVTPVLKWVRSEQESEIREAFSETLAVRKLGPEAENLADRYFFETLVRVHRASEGEPYTGLKPAGFGVEPAVADADKALETGKVEELVNEIQQETVRGIQERFQHAYEARQHAGESVAAGRGYVKAYVEFIHYVERLHRDATNPAVHNGAAGDQVHVTHE